MTILSHLPMSDSITPIFEDTLEPPTMAAKGRLGLSTAYRFIHIERGRERGGVGSVCVRERIYSTTAYQFIHISSL